MLVPCGYWDKLPQTEWYQGVGCGHISLGGTQFNPLHLPSHLHPFMSLSLLTLPCPPPCFPLLLAPPHSFPSVPASSAHTAQSEWQGICSAPGAGERVEAQAVAEACGVPCRSGPQTRRAREQTGAGPKDTAKSLSSSQEKCGLVSLHRIPSLSLCHQSYNLRWPWGHSHRAGGHLEGRSRNENLAQALWEHKEVHGLAPACRKALHLCTFPRKQA